MATILRVSRLCKICNTFDWLPISKLHSSPTLAIYLPKCDDELKLTKWSSHRRNYHYCWEKESFFGFILFAKIAPCLSLSVCVKNNFLQSTKLILIRLACDAGRLSLERSLEFWVSCINQKPLWVQARIEYEPNWLSHTCNIVNFHQLWSCGEKNLASFWQSLCANYSHFHHQRLITTR